MVRFSPEQQEERTKLGFVAVCRRMRAVVVLLGVAAWSGSQAALAQDATESSPVARVAFVADEGAPFTEDIRRRVQDELLALARGEINVRFPDELQVTAGRAEVEAVVARLAADDEVALLITHGLIASEVAARGAPWAVPVIAASVFDPVLQGLPESNGASGVANLAYIAPPAPGPMVRDLVRFRELASFDRVSILLSEEASVTFAAFVEELQRAVAELGIDLEPVPVGATAASGIDGLADDSEAVYLTPLTGMDAGEFELLAKAITARGLPSFSWSADDVAHGIMASLGTIDPERLARRIALNAWRILLGDDAGKLPVSFAPSAELVINMRTVRELGLMPPLGALLEARRLFEVPLEARELTLEGAMEEAMAASLALAMEDEEVRAGAEEVRIARANLLPNLEAGLSGATISSDVAESSFGLRPERNLDSALTVRQVLFSQEANANLFAQKSLQASREANREALGLDVALEAAEAYLGVLRGKTLEQVQQDNLDLTLASLRLARERERIGTAGPGERLRLESELARRRADRIDAFARRSAAEVSLNQVLNRPLDEPFSTPQAGPAGRALLESNLATTYLEDLNRAAPLAEFLVQAALDFSPGMRSLDAAVSAQERLLASTRQAFYMPTVALQANVTSNVLRDGAGTAPPPGLPVGDMPDHPWTVGLSVSLPLYQGNARSARRDRADAALRQLKFQRQLAARQIEQNVRIQLQFARAGLAVVGETESAARAGRRSLELVTEAYGQGLASVVDLLEAQTSALISDRAVTNAIFDYLVGLKRVEHAVGRFEALSTPEQRGDFVMRLTNALEGES